MASEHDILVAGSFDDSAIERLGRVGAVRFASDSEEATLVREVAGADALLARTYARVTARVIEAGSALKVIGRAGVGLDNIDLAAARRCGVRVVYTPAAASDTVAEFAVGLMLGLERRIARGQALLREGRFIEARQSLVGRQMRGLTLGIVGMGRIGGRVGRICRCGLGMAVRYNDIVDIGGLDFEAEAVSKDRIWCESDVVSLHVPLTDLTRGLVNAEVLDRFRPGATLINTSRGAVVDTTALATALEHAATGKDGLAGAALDVYEQEPPPPEHPLLAAPNALLTPHIAARTGVGLARMNDVVDDVLAVLAGAEPQYPAPDE